MRKLYLAILALALIGLLPGKAFAIPCNPNTDKWNLGQWCVTTTDTLVPTTSASSQVVYESYTSVNTANALLENESGKVIVDTGGAPTSNCTADLPCGGSTHTLPRAKVGLIYTLSAGSEATVTLDTVDSSDRILYSITGTELSAGDKIISTGQAGDSVTVVCPVAGKWAIASMKGVWTDGN